MLIKSIIEIFSFNSTLTSADLSLLLALERTLCKNKFVRVWHLVSQRREEHRLRCFRTDCWGWHFRQKVWNKQENRENYTRLNFIIWTVQVATFGIAGQGGWGGWCKWHLCVRRENACRVWVGQPKAKGSSEWLRHNENTLLKWIEKQGDGVDRNDVAGNF
jgi:hypothetical protein